MRVTAWVVVFLFAAMCFAAAIQMWEEGFHVLSFITVFAGVSMVYLLVHIERKIKAERREYRTRSGKVLTDADIEKLRLEAEVRDYEVTRTKPMGEPGADTP